MRVQTLVIPKPPWQEYSEYSLAGRLAILASWSKNPHSVMHDNPLRPRPVRADLWLLDLASVLMLALFVVIVAL